MKHYTHLSEEERKEIFRMLADGHKQNAIAEEIGRDPWTVSREIARNSTVFPKARNAAKDKTKEDYRYLPDSAQKKYADRRKLCGWRPPLRNPRVFEYVVRKLREKRWSPDAIAGRLAAEHPDDPSMRISHECVYQFAYSELGEELELKKFLLRAHKRRKKKTGRSVRKVSNIPDRRDISERPASVLEREEFGHFEGDSVLSVRPSKSAFRTEVERASRFLMAEKVLRKTAECALSAATRMYRGLPEGAVKSVTYDNGCEHSRHAELSAALGGVPVYFAKPYHSWERGTNEHANGMLRRFFPKGADFDLVTDEELRAAVDAINDTPRKILRYRTAREAFHEYLSTFS